MPDCQSLYDSWTHSVHNGTMWHQCTALSKGLQNQRKKEKSVCWDFTLNVCTKTCKRICICMSVPLCVNESGWKVWNRSKTTAVLFTAQSSTEPVVKQYLGLILMISCPDFFAYSFWELHLIHMAALWSAKRLPSSQPSSFCNLKQVLALFCFRDKLHLFFIVCLWLDVKGAGTVKKTKPLKCPASMSYLLLIKWK